jgi:hypothetical protein
MLPDSGNKSILIEHLTFRSRSEIGIQRPGRIFTAVVPPQDGITPVVSRNSASGLAR